jgi:tRNA wybutosine-synthesizing protein 2
MVSFLILEQKNPEFLENPNSLKESLKGSLSEAELASILTGWQVLGYIIIVFIPEVLEDEKNENN